ncbi:hypothetical protein A4G29_14435 [Mycobacterium kansasii]|nr:hypothetical protein A4G29_14435 [Mycobacterium kansasii]
MSYVLTAHEMAATAAVDVAGIRSAISTANAAAAAPISGVLAAAGDEVATAIATLFSGYGREYQAVMERAAAFHADFTAVQGPQAALVDIGLLPSSYLPGYLSVRSVTESGPVAQLRPAQRDGPVGAELHARVDTAPDPAGESLRENGVAATLPAENSCGSTRRESARAAARC